MRLIYLDAIRAVLSVVVLLYHWGLTKFLSGLFPGFAGGAWGLAVDYFFLLSGFVLCLSLSRRSISLFKFIAIRGFRLLPVAIVSLGLFLAVEVWTAPDFVMPGVDILANLFLLQSFVSCKSLPKTMWSASFEMWLPSVFTLFGFLRLSRTSFLCCFLVLFLLLDSFAAFSFQGLETAGMGAYIRAIGGLVSGYLLGVVFLRFAEFRVVLSSKRFFLAGWICFALAIVSIFLAADFRWAGAVFPVFSALSIFLLALAEWGRECAFSSSAQRLVEYFATRSYSIYLLHMPIIALSLRLFGSHLKGNILLRLVLIAFTVLLADVVYRYIEVPGFRLRRRFPALAS